MAMTPEMDTARMERTMRVIEYEEDKPKIKRFLEEPLNPEAEPEVPTELFSVPLITTVSGQDG
jgi:hypothetical protein